MSAPAMHAPRRLKRWCVGLTLTGVALFPAVAQLQTPPAQDLVRVSDETAMLAQGWAALAAGDAGKAAERAQAVLARYPQSVGALALVVEAALARGGAMAGLTTYESWLGTRKLEDPFVVRRIAIASLRETMNSKDASGRLIALKSLAAEGDAEALSILAAAAAKDQYGETSVMAELGDAKAVQALVRRMETNPAASKMMYIAALAATKSKLAVPPLTKLLDSPDPYSGVVAAAIDALGKLDARETIPRLRPLVEEGHPPQQRWAAARALSLMGDGAGTPFLRQMLTYTDPNVPQDGVTDMLQIDAAEALAPLGPNPDWMNTARRLLGSSNPQVRVKAARLIAAQDQALAKDTLESLLLDENPAIREMATDVLASRVAGDFLTLRRLLRLSDLASRARAAARIVELTR